jgi:hypothetical protein
LRAALFTLAFFSAVAALGAAGGVLLRDEPRPARVFHPHRRCDRLGEGLLQEGCRCEWREARGWVWVTEAGPYRGSWCPGFPEAR